MKALRLKVLIPILIIHALFLTGLYLIFVSFSLPEAFLDGCDRLALPGEELELVARVSLDEPGPGPLRRSGIQVVFSEGGKQLGSAISDNEGYARIKFRAGSPTDVHRAVRIDLNVGGGLEVAYHLPRPALFVEVISRGITLYLCDLDCTLARGSWEELDPRHPEDWKADPQAAPVLHRLSRGSLSRVVYLAPGKRLCSQAAHFYLRKNGLPLGPVLFPEACPGPQDLGSFAEELLKKWPHAAHLLTRTPSLVDLFARRKVEVMVINARPGSITPGTFIQLIGNWLEAAEKLPP